MAKSRWIHNNKFGADRASKRLFCFHHAGGNAANFNAWINEFMPSIDICAIQLPGRAERINDKFLPNFDCIVNILANEISNYDDLPFAFFGHSMGGVLAFELCHYLVEHKLQTPIHLFISSANSPSNLYRSTSIMKNDQQLIDMLKRYGGTPSELLHDKGFMAFLLPIMRADFDLLSNYTYKIRQKLSIPLTLITGDKDFSLTYETLPAWANETSQAYRHICLNGGHFYHHQEPASVISIIWDTLLR